ncbi:hypothetical protein U1Q18_043464 [Sarracenia purpurea var. burkii]
MKLLVDFADTLFLVAFFRNYFNWYKPGVEGGNLIKKFNSWLAIKVLFVMVYYHVAIAVYGAFVLGMFCCLCYCRAYAAFVLGKCLGCTSLLGSRLIIVAACFGCEYP